MFDLDDMDLVVDARDVAAKEFRSALQNMARSGSGQEPGLVAKLKADLDAISSVLDHLVEWQHQLNSWEWQAARLRSEKSEPS